ncbi:S-adenosyl-L-methionine-dependent methyltransferase [Wolfiporia cocos MD-104 SS10]|uniref:S-adenosyl-L-methionine-dependent methyltransferase n=1 Tax=Wolfiporia cocos (strain MD-104) TaxID=742152 RepID=A0A2H3JF78_WOLCO|nr:S-adenosyl-L-methionine-dependent methyltransferase [Wolfiporia cocos MD-104 SS10]
MSSRSKTDQLRSLLRLLNDAANTILTEWEAEEQIILDSSQPVTHPSVPTAELFEARRIFLGACGMCIDIVQDPLIRLTEVVFSHLTAAALRVAAEARIADILAKADPNEGLSIKEITRQCGIQDWKLVRVLRCLCGLNIFAETRNECFINTPTSHQLVGNEQLRFNSSMEMSAASAKLSAVLFDPIKTKSTSPRETAFQEAFATTMTLWEYLEHVSKGSSASSLGQTPLDIWTTGMTAGAQVELPTLCMDYPWGDLGPCLVIDVGGGVGGKSLELAKHYPNLRFIIQDREDVLVQAHAVWHRDYPAALAAGRVAFMPHDFFTKQTVIGADIYLLGNILHDWPDDECVTILKNLRQAMKLDSRILVIDQVVHTTVGSPSMKTAPPPLLPNYGYASHYAATRTLSMLTLFNGTERTPEELEALAAQSGLKVMKIWECRSMAYITELRRADVVM